MHAYTVCTYIRTHIHAYVCTYVRMYMHTTHLHSVSGWPGHSPLLLAGIEQETSNPPLEQPPLLHLNRGRKGRRGNQQWLNQYAHAYTHTCAHTLHILLVEIPCQPYWSAKLNLLLGLAWCQSPVTCRAVVSLDTYRRTYIRTYILLYSRSSHGVGGFNRQVTNFPIVTIHNVTSVSVVNQVVPYLRGGLTRQVNMSTFIFV